MTNRKRLNSMAMIDMLMELKEMGTCFILDGTDDNESRCEKYNKCYDCIAAWLNEESKENYRRSSIETLGS